LEIGALLVALKAKGEAPQEIAGAAEALRNTALPFETGDLQVADSCGTGGDGAGTVNISTAVALVAARAGVPVAKHGNRSVSSQCGSADVLEQCGVKIDMETEVAQKALQELGVCFLFAPRYHSGMRHAMPVRRALGVRTIFNLIGPLANPARPHWQVVGVYHPDLCVPIAETLGMLGCQAALVVHGAGLDEIALHAESQAAMWRDGRLERKTIEPRELSLERYPPEELRGGDPEHNARWLQALLRGEGSEAHNSAVALNAGALLWISGRTPDLEQGLQMAKETLLSGLVADTLSGLSEISHGA
jgi:anthranilate phosphoribosyltransferase